MTHDNELKLLEELSIELSQEYQTSTNVWLSSRFAWIKLQPIASIGKIGEALFKKWLAAKQIPFSPRTDPSHDLIISDQKIEIKFATLGKDGMFTFNQIRDQDYDWCLLFGIRPNAEQSWLVPKPQLFVAGRMKPQHGGKKADSDTNILQFKANEVPAWLLDFGGNLTLVQEIIQKKILLRLNPKNP